MSFQISLRRAFVNVYTVPLALTAYLLSAALADASGRPDIEKMVFSRTYQSAVSSNGEVAEARVMSDGRVRVVLNGKQIKRPAVLQHSPVFSEDGKHLAWIDGDNKHSRSQLYLDQSSLGASGCLDKSPVFDRKGNLWWLRSCNYKGKPRTRGDKICLLSSDEFSTGKDAVKCLPVDGSLFGLVAWNGNVAAISRQSISGKFNLIELSQSSDKSIKAHFKLTSKNSIVSRGGQVFEVKTEGNIAPLFWSYFAAFDEFTHEPLVMGGNGLGRLSWHQSNRLRLLADLSFATRDTDIQKRLQKMVKKLLSVANERGRFPAKKYSADRKTLQEIIVLDAVLYDALLYAYPLLPQSQRKLLLKKVNLFLNESERDWNGHYYNFVAKDGTVRNMPFNQQNALGLVMIRLMGIAGGRQYEKRVKKLFAALRDEITIIEEVQYWPYWPKQPSEIDTSRFNRSEDTGHAGINIEFLHEASQFLGKRNPARIEKLAKQVNPANKWMFTRRMDDQVHRTAHSPHWLPSRGWAKSARIAKHFNRWHGSSREWFDVQQLNSVYGRIAVSQDDHSGTISVTKLTPGGKSPTRINTVTGVLDYETFLNILR